MRCHSILAITLAVLAGQRFAPAADVIVRNNVIHEVEILAEADGKLQIKWPDGLEESLDAARYQTMHDVDTDGYLHSRLAGLDPKDLAGRKELLVIAGRNRRREIAELIATQMLAIDPADAAAGRALSFVLVDGRYVDPAEVTLSAQAKANSEAPEVTGPAIKVVVSERIDGLDWKDYLALSPNPDYKSSIGQQLGGQLFFHGHGWGVPTTPEGEAQALYTAKITIEATKGRVNTWMEHVVQTFYEAKITLEVTRNADGVKVLSVVSTRERGNRHESTAARAAILEAASAIVKDERIQKLALWQDPAAAVAMGTPIDAGKKPEK